MSSSRHQFQLGPFFNYTQVRPCTMYLELRLDSLSLHNVYVQIKSELVERAQNWFLGVARFLLKIDHPQYRYKPVIEVLRLNSLQKYTAKSGLIILT